MKYLVAALAITASILGPSPAIAEPVACYEDQACWDPATMGNGLGHLPAGQVPRPGDHSIA